MNYRLGLPAWGFPGWRGRFLTAKPTLLASYARVFNAVEGNTTFYRTPDENTVATWRAAVEGSDFKFCFKLPRSITHEPTPALDEMRSFLRAIEPLGEYLGPLLLQFPARVGPGQLPVLSSLFSKLPREFHYVLEVRHPLFFAQPLLLEPLLEDYRFGRVVLDTRALYQGDRKHPEVVGALHEKPDLPVLPEVYNDLAFVRLVLHPDRLYNDYYIDQWAARVADYVARQYTTFVMIHCPNNMHCPELAVEFHEALRNEPKMNGLVSLESWSVPEQRQLI